jgi:hypothetical protein
MPWIPILMAAAVLLCVLAYCLLAVRLRGAPTRGEPRPAEPEGPSYRSGRFLVRRAGLWWLVCVEAEPAPGERGELVLDQFALLSSARRRADELAASHRR